MIGFIVPKATAIPSYARQTGLSCNGCHYTPPELNAAGRRFKLTGYVDRKADNAVTSPSDKRHAGLDLLASLPLSAWFETSFTNTKAPQPSTQNGNFEFPQDISLFLAGAWSTHIGSFLQVTYSTQDDHFTMDNTDLRYARVKQVNGKEWVWGVDLNNNPTVEDLWNSTPAWGFPFIASDVAPTPTAAPIIQSLGQDVAGIGAYTMWNQHLYLDGTIYRSAHIASTQPPTGEGFPFNIRGVAPYWRVAWEQNRAKDSIEFGTYGMHMDSTPGAVVGAQDRFTDIAFDFQYDRTIVRKDVFSLRGTYIRENSDLIASFGTDAAVVSKHHLNTFNTNAEYHFGSRYSAALGWFSTTGTSDPLLFPSAPISGNANGNPQSNGYVLNFSVWPIQNLDLGIQYTGYTRFNGAANNYDGAGRNANGNNTIYLLARFVF
jgi:hypothetical protein